MIPDTNAHLVADFETLVIVSRIRVVGFTRSVSSDLRIQNSLKAFDLGIQFLPIDGIYRSDPYYC